MAYNCIEYAGKHFQNGYGTCKCPSTGKTITSSKFTYEQHRGPVPEGMVVMHTCDNRSCINIDHLVVGTQSQNIQDAYDRGRKVPVKRKLNIQQARGVKELIKAEVSNIAIAAMFGISSFHVSNIKHGRSWAHVQV